MIWALMISLSAYAWIVLRRWVAWIKLPVEDAPTFYTPHTQLSVIIPVRNEEQNILLLLQDLETQKYPKHLYEVIVVDDHSDDQTVKLIGEYQTCSTMSLSLLCADKDAGMRMKKGAVKRGLQEAKGELMVLTDGDCRVGPEWLLQYAYKYEKDNPLFISGPVCFHNTKSTFERMQLVEFASLIGIGGASLALVKPNMCNGANLAYTKSVFESVDGFSGNEHVASGDDEFLLHKVNKDFPGKAVFLKNEKVIVYTEARKSIASFLAQRIRWASKWKAYQSINVQMVAMVVFMVNFMLFACIPLFLFGEVPVLVITSAYIIKFIIDFLFLERILNFLGRKQFLWHIFPLQLVYIPYVISAGVMGLFGRYHWKGRSIRNS
jgi:poly-beta-1,6-N-acetyl-D-glucosamine synthase